MSAPTMDQILEIFVPDSALTISNSITTLVQQCQPNVISPAALVDALKQTVITHAYRHHVSQCDPNFIFGKRDLPKAKNGRTGDQVEAVPWPRLPDGSTVPKQAQHSRDIRAVYKKFNPNPAMDDFRGICSAGDYAWLHASNITAIVEAARHALRGKKFHEFCVKKSLVKLCIVTSKCPVFIQKLNDALFEAKPLYTPVQQGDDVLYRNQRMMVCATNADGTMVQLCPTEEDQTIDSNVWISRADIDQKLAKKSRAMSSAETDVMTDVLQRAYDAAVLALENDPTRFVRGEDPAKAIMFYIYLAVMYEMPTYVQPRGVILRNDWQSIVFDGPGVDHDKDNYLTFGDDARCTLTLNSNTKTNANGEQVKRFDISHTRLVEFLRQWEPHARAMQNQTVKTKTRSIQISARAPYVVVHYSCTHPDVFARPYVKEGDFYNNVKKSVIQAYPALKNFKECIGTTSARKTDTVMAAASRKRRFGDTVTSESIADERATASRRLHSASTAHAVYERQDAP
jgi:hypothetical protein